MSEFPVSSVALEGAKRRRARSSVRFCRNCEYFDGEANISEHESLLLQTHLDTRRYDVSRCRTHRPQKKSGWQILTQQLVATSRSSGSLLLRLPGIDNRSPRRRRRKKKKKKHLTSPHLTSKRSTFLQIVFTLTVTNDEGTSNLGSCATTTVPPRRVYRWRC